MEKTRTFVAMIADTSTATHHFRIVFVRLFRSFFDNDPQLVANNGFITDDQSTPPLCAAIFLLFRLNRMLYYK